ncbi:hypothetical protein DMC47_08345 [Nostoc sp. 3335mG]|nr:hypothetical protein DMC47_08345 [Nostoc sp. 3335mG]
MNPLAHSLFALTLAALLLPAAPALAQTDDQDDGYEDIIVTAVRQGGAQDIKSFRNIAADVGMPRPETLTVEGLMGEHDLTLPAAKACAKLFCLTGEAMPATLALRGDDRLFVGVGFASNIDAATWRRAPLNLVAVVDKSGSMDGKPLDRVRASLLQILGQMRDGDRMSIILYGDRSHVYLAPTDIAAGRDRIAAAIREIRSEGSTNMEAGLRVGYDTAFADAPGFKGNTRMMLFTDEQPNVGATDAESFMGMAQEASRRGIGLTTIGVGTQFDGPLATRVSSVRGGNLFFIASDDDVKTVFDRQFDTMVSELAHDLKVTLTPAAGYRISGVFGVPADVMTETPEGAITVTVPSVFLSTNGGGIFATMTRSADRANLPLAPVAPGAPLLTATVTWNGPDGTPGTDAVAVDLTPTRVASVPLRKAHLLVDEYLSLKEATTAFHQRNDPKAAYALVDGLASRMGSSGLDGLDGEARLVADLRQRAGFYSGFGGEPPKSLRHLTVVGRWKVTGASGFEDIHRGDQIEFTADRQMRTYRAKTGYVDAAEEELYEINQSAIHMTESNLVMSYSTRNGRMMMHVNDPNGSSRIWLTRMN